MTRLAGVVLTALAACGISHPSGTPVDGGPLALDAPGIDGPAPPRDGGPQITSCDDDVFGAPAGTTCAVGLECVSGDATCVRRSASCPEGVLVFDETDRWGFREGCADSGACSLDGVTPAGPFHIGSGVASLSHGFSVDAYLIFFAGVAIADCGIPMMSFPLEPSWARGKPSYVGTHAVDAWLHLETGRVMVSGSATIDIHELGTDGLVHLSGELDVRGATHTVQGPFSITECPVLNRSAP